jgi:predicted naringenin-chalcone synthase
MEYSYRILENMGNMSSATIPHIWKEILEHEPDKTLVVTLAFGPGLTICGAMMETCHNEVKSGLFDLFRASTGRGI